MINSVTVTNFTGEKLVLHLRNPETSGLIIMEITGIGPEKANIYSTEIVTGDGAIYNTGRLPARNIVMVLRYDPRPGETVEDIRQMTYKYFAIKQKISLMFETSNRKAEIVGYVEANEPVIFSDASYTQISIICPNPYFFSEKTQSTLFFGVEDMFEFPFSNESLTEPMLVMGEIININEQTVFYEGDGEIGIKIHIYAIGEVNNVTITNLRTREVMFIDTEKLKTMTGFGLIRGDEIQINTIRGEKSIILIREGETINLLNVLGRNTAWFQLAKGDNVFIFTAESGTINLQFRITNKVIYEGV